SGTTGHPKGCLHTHRTVMHTTVAGPECCFAPKDTVVLANLPMFHVTGMQHGVTTPVWRGNTIVVMTRWDKACAARLIERHRCGSWTAIPTMLMDFLHQDLSAFDLSSMHILTGGGAAMPKAVAERIRQLWGIDYVEGYGLSETMAPTHLNPVHRPKPQCLGLPIFDVDSRVVDPQSFEELPPGEVGEIVSHGPQVMLGYHGRPADDPEPLVELDGTRVPRTGDLAYVDDEGYFFMVDRLKRMINASGYKIWPAEVEAMLYGHPAVQEACVIAVRDAHRGESAKAVIVPREGHEVTPGDIIEWARGRMAAYKVPHEVEFRTTLPRSATGKVQWRGPQAAEGGRGERRAAAAGLREQRLALGTLHLPPAVPAHAPALAGDRAGPAGRHRDRPGPGADPRRLFRHVVRGGHRRLAAGQHPDRHRAVGVRRTLRAGLDHAGAAPGAGLRAATLRHAGPALPGDDRHVAVVRRAGVRARHH